jgi:hypothetical protein
VLVLELLMWDACSSDTTMHEPRRDDPAPAPAPAPAPSADDVEDAGDDDLLPTSLTAPPYQPPHADDLADLAAEAFFAEGTIYDFSLSIPASSRAKLATAPFGWVPGTFRTNEGTWSVQLRLKGTTSFRDLSGKAAFKIDFTADDPLVRFHGLKRLTLNAMMQDSSMLHEHTTYWLYRHRGVPAPRHTYARVTVDGVDYGLHGVVETMDEQFLKRALTHDTHGNLYEANVSDFATGRTDHFEIEETDGLYEPYVDIDEAIAAIEAAPPEQYLATLASIFDLDQLMRMWAIEIVTTNVDGYAWFANNYMAYHGKNAWHILPWGNDQCLEWYRDVGDYSRFGGRLVIRCGETPDCHAMLDQAMLDLVDDWQSSDIVRMVTAETALIQGDCDRDPRAELPCDTAHVLRFVQERPKTIYEELSAP